ncbi:MAG: Sua5/YciO/YrdC/YwlC family protein, partial [Planctomycetes bacterium]|nr:Sua5/YciO/YrdC/YwlC family protein [Planctomycetota bacterium]
MPMLLDWRSASQPDELLRTVVEALRQGWFVGLPAEDGYLVLFRADQAAAMEKLPSAGARSLAVLVKGTVDVEAWTGGLSPSVKRLLDRLWPGPLGAIAEAKPDIPNTFGRVVSDDGFVRLRSSRHPLVEAIQYAVDFP